MERTPLGSAKSVVPIGDAKFGIRISRLRCTTPKLFASRRRGGRTRNRGAKWMTGAAHRAVPVFVQLGGPLEKHLRSAGCIVARRHGDRAYDVRGLPRVKVPSA